MYTRRNLILAVTLLCGLPRLAQAWNERGHMLVAALAYQQLTDCEKAQIKTILSAHPHVVEWLRKDVPAGADPAQWAFMRAATWPDFVRGFESEKHHQSNWHYISLPLVDLADPSPAIHSDPRCQPGHVDAVSVIQACVQALRGNSTRVNALRHPGTMEFNQAVALSWILHLAGDLHQPLHTVRLFRDDLPLGDDGGNALKARWQGDPTPNPERKFGEMNSLHSFWDGCLGTDVDLASIMSAVKSLSGSAETAQSSFECCAIRQLNPNVWADEGRQISKNFVYQFGKIRFSTDPNHPTDLSSLHGYEAEARSIARQRLSLAGYRLAALLRCVLND